MELCVSVMKSERHGWEWKMEMGIIIFTSELTHNIHRRQWAWHVIVGYKVVGADAYTVFLHQ